MKFLVILSLSLFTLFLSSVNVRGMQEISELQLYSASLSPDAKLFMACEFGDIQLARQALEEGANPNAIIVERSPFPEFPDRIMPPPFQRAVSNLSGSKKSLELIELLVSNGADIEVRDNEGRTPLAFAVVCGDIGVIKYLLSKGANLEARDEEGLTPLARAVRDHLINVAELLIEHGADSNTQDIEGRNLLYHTGELPMIELLVRFNIAINSVDKAGKTPLYNAAQWGYCDIVDFLLSHGAHFTLHDGVQTPKDDRSKAYCLLKGKYEKDLDVHGIESTEIDRYKWLIEHGAIISGKGGKTLFDIALKCSEDKIALWLLLHGASFSDQTLSLLNSFNCYPIAENPINSPLIALIMLDDENEAARQVDDIDRQMLDVPDISYALFQAALYNRGKILKAMFLRFIRKMACESLTRALIIAGMHNNQAAFMALVDGIVHQLESTRAKEDYVDHWLPIAAAFEQAEGLVGKLLRKFKRTISLEQLKEALIAAASSGSSKNFLNLYNYLRLKHPNQFSEPLESALYWATINRQESMVRIILERAFILDQAPHLSLERTQNHVEEILILNPELPDDQRIRLENIRENLRTITQLREQENDNTIRSTLENIFSQLPFRLSSQLPPEVITAIGQFILRPRILQEPK